MDGRGGRLGQLRDRSSRDTLSRLDPGLGREDEELAELGELREHVEEESLGEKACFVGVWSLESG